MKYFLLLFIFIVNTLSSCKFQSSKNSIERDLSSIIPIDSIIFKIDFEDPPGLSVPNITIKDSVNLVWALNRLKNIINCYSFNTGQKIKSIDLDKFEEFYSLNELLSFQVNDDKLIFISDNGLFVEYSLKTETPIYILQTYESLPENRIIFDSNLMPAISLKPYLYLVANIHLDRYGYGLFSTINTQEDKVLFKGTVPDEVIEGFFSFKRFAYWNYVLKDSTIIANFPNRKELYFYSLEGELLKKVFFNTNLFDNKDKTLIDYDSPKLAHQNGISIQEIELKAKQLGIYEALLYNEKRNNYYRIVGHPISINRLDLNDPVLSEVRQYSVIVGDDDFNIIAEYQIPYNRYEMDSKSYFIVDGKLYIMRRIINENETVFDIFEL